MQDFSVERRWTAWLPLLVAVGAFFFYWASAPPSITWAHFGADGAELLTAALTNGVPHPPGYPLYILLLQAWLRFASWLTQADHFAWYGNLLSGLFAAASVGVTVQVVRTLLAESAQAWLWATFAGLAWAVAPLPWGQAVITEVYALHMLLIALLGWCLFVKPERPWWLAVVIALGTAHHLTFLLFLPAVLYYRWRTAGGDWSALWRSGFVMGVGVLVGILFYLRIPLAAASVPPSPVNWGYPTDWEGFWWLVSGAAYRSYLFSAPSSTILSRIAAWANTLTTQYTPVGLAIALLGLSQWDRHQSDLRNFSLLWVVPVSIYSINYYTRDSEIYLLPVVWLAALWLGVGLTNLSTWAQTDGLGWWQRVRPPATGQTVTRAPTWVAPILAALLSLGLLEMTTWRWSSQSLRQDQQADQFIAGVMAVIEADSIIISSADNETFSLWYAAWGSGVLRQRAPQVVLLNYALYQFPWYQRLVAKLYPEVVGDSQSIEEILARNVDKRTIFFSEKFSFWSTDELQPAGPIWRYQPRPAE
ncbi:MAG: DUF2723 domain-containing protein [Caldilineaceae bacterium]|nr:DUF2723 domain-containing protein [Caldilineaceae bacterium]